MNNNSNTNHQEVIIAAQLNQTGASCLTKNQLEQAQKYFQAALESVTLAGHDLDSSSEDTTSMNNNNDATNNSTTTLSEQPPPSANNKSLIVSRPQEEEEDESMMMCDTTTDTKTMINSSSTTSNENEGYYIYSKPFFFNPSASLTEEEIAPYGGVILFNLALTYHEKSRRRMGGEASLKVAMRLYEKCLTLVKHATTFDCSNVIIAALNNQARIYEELLDYKRASRRFKLLAEFLNEDDVRTDTLEQEDLQDIFLNIFFFKPPTCAAMA